MAHTVGRAGGDEGVGDLPQPLRRRGAANLLWQDRSATCDSDVNFTLVCGCSSQWLVGVPHDSLWMRSILHYSLLED